MRKVINMKTIMFVCALGLGLLAVPQVTHTSNSRAVAPELIQLSDMLADDLGETALELEKYQPDWEVALRSYLLPEDEEPRDIGPQTDAEYVERLVAAINVASEATGMDPAMIWAVSYTETHGQHWNPRGTIKRGGAGEVGLMQVLPSWERMLKKEYDVELDLYNFEDNVMAGALILSRGGEERRVILSYYNTGQRVYNTPYQRKVMRYWDSFDRRYQ